MLASEILRNLSPNEKLQVVTDLWNQLANEEIHLTLPPEELAEMDRRREQMTQDPNIAITADEVWRWERVRCDGG